MINIKKVSYKAASVIKWCLNHPMCRLICIGFAFVTLFGYFLIMLRIQEDRTYDIEKQLDKYNRHDPTLHNTKADTKHYFRVCKEIGFKKYVNWIVSEPRRTKIWMSCVLLDKLYKESNNNYYQH